MKCQKCNKQATFHITDLTGDELLALHLCPDCAKAYLQADESPSKPPLLSGVIGKQAKLEQTAEDLRDLDSKQCPVCGITFYEFRQMGRLGCPHDYVFFGNELEPLLVNVHGDNQHKGKRPARGVDQMDSQTELIRLRREMKDVIEQENYEKATEIRDRIRKIQEEHASQRASATGSQDKEKSE